MPGVLGMSFVAFPLTAAADWERLRSSGVTTETGNPLVATSGLADGGCGDAGCCTEEVSVLWFVAAEFSEGGRGLFSAASEGTADCWLPGDALLFTARAALCKNRCYYDSFLLFCDVMSEKQMYISETMELYLCHHFEWAACMQNKFIRPQNFKLCAQNI